MSATSQTLGQPPLARALGTRMAPLLVVLVVAVTLSAPVASFVVGTSALRDATEATARDVARVVFLEAEARPALWQYDSPKLALRLDAFRSRADVRAIVVTDPGGRPIELTAAERDQLRAESLVWSHLVVGGSRAHLADVWVASRTERVRHSAQSLLLPFALLGTLLAALLWLVARRSIVQAQARVDGSHAALTELASSLEREVVRRSAELAVAYEALRQKEGRLRELSTRALALQESERRAIARDLHDSAGQALTAIRIHLQILAQGARPLDEMKRLAEETMRMTDITLEDLRRAVQLLAPAVLAELGLTRALEREIDAFAERTGIEVDREIALGPQALPEAAETATYRIVQEALTNVARHARASRIRVLVRVDDTALLVEVEDDGVGLAATPASVDGSGLRGMRERAELAGGSLSIVGASVRGTLVRLVLPHGAPPHGARPIASPSAPPIA